MKHQGEMDIMINYVRIFSTRWWAERNKR